MGITSTVAPPPLMCLSSSPLSDDASESGDWADEYRDESWFEGGGGELARDGSARAESAVWAAAAAASPRARRARELDGADDDAPSEVADEADETVWVEAWDAATSSAYFYNAATHETSWVLPRGERAVPLRTRGEPPRSLDEDDISSVEGDGA